MRDLGPKPAELDAIGRSTEMQDVLRLIEAVAPTRAPVLFVGETGTGKGLLARALHKRSLRIAERFVPVNCAALTQERLAAELLGVAGERPGAVDRARGGTLFLKAVGDLPLEVQEALSQLLRPFGAQGGGCSRADDVRLVAATSEHPITAATEGRFHPALLSLLDGVRIGVPPLRERGGDVPQLAEHFLAGAAARAGRKAPRVSPEALALLEQHRWDGNVRELENAMERAAVVYHGDEVGPGDLPGHLKRPAEERQAREEVDLYGLSFREAKERAVEAFERRYAEEVLVRAGGNVSEAARFAGLDRSNLRRLMARYGVRPGGFRAKDSG
jgi:DNA-binding NtrC family response regulator